MKMLRGLGSFKGTLIRPEDHGYQEVVAPAGFEPAISALKGPRPRPLDDGAGYGVGLD